MQLATFTVRTVYKLYVLDQFRVIGGIQHLAAITHLNSHKGSTKVITWQWYIMALSPDFNTATQWDKSNSKEYYISWSCQRWTSHISLIGGQIQYQSNTFPALSGIESKAKIWHNYHSSRQLTTLHHVGPTEGDSLGKIVDRSVTMEGAIRMCHRFKNFEHTKSAFIKEIGMS